MNNDIELRLRRLERHNRILLTGLCCIAIVGTFTAAKSFVVQEADLVKAKRFVLLDDRGYEVGSLGYSKGISMLKLGSSGSVMLTSNTDNDGGHLRFSGTNSVDISASVSGGSALSLVQDTKDGRAQVNMTTNGTSPEFHLFGTDKAGVDLRAKIPAVSLKGPKGVVLQTLPDKKADHSSPSSPR
jgi:hypothetical protein